MNPASEQRLQSRARTLDDVHRLRGIRLEGLKRDPHYFLKKQGLRLDPEQWEEDFDTDTLFYDVFFEPTNRRLIAVGPPPGNLQIDPQIYVNGEPIKRVSKLAAPRVWLMMGSVDRVEKLNEVLVQANGHQWRLRVPANNTGTGHKFTLCAIQKDNREQWIRDWIKHYRKIGVDRVILYDNNSKKLPDVDAIVIPCPYKFGLAKYRYLHGAAVRRTCFLHPSMLTVCGYKYRSGQLLNFDIDELLQVESLEKYGKRKVVYFDSYFVETKTDRKLPKDYSFRHFVYRNARKRNVALKFIVRMDALLYIVGMHGAKLEPEPKPKPTLTRKIAGFLQRVWNKLKARLPKKLRLKPTAKTVTEDEDIFYHYKGINTGWKTDRSAFDETTEMVKIGN